MCICMYTAKLLRRDFGNCSCIMCFPLCVSETRVLRRGGRRKALGYTIVDRKHTKGFLYKNTSGTFKWALPDMQGTCWTDLTVFVI